MNRRNFIKSVTSGFTLLLIYPSMLLASGEKITNTELQRYLNKIARDMGLNVVNGPQCFCYDQDKKYIYDTIDLGGIKPEGEPFLWIRNKVISAFIKTYKKYLRENYIKGGVLAWRRPAEIINKHKEGRSISTVHCRLVVAPPGLKEYDIKNTLSESDLKTAIIEIGKFKEPQYKALRKKATKNGELFFA